VKPFRKFTNVDPLPDSDKQFKIRPT